MYTREYQRRNRRRDLYDDPRCFPKKIDSDSDVKVICQQYMKQRTCEYTVCDDMTNNANISYIRLYF